MRPSQALSQHRDAVCLAAARYRVANPRVFGSALHGDDMKGSDLDLLVDPLPGTTLFDWGGLQDELQTLLGVSVDVLTPKDLPPKFRSGGCPIIWTTCVKRSLMRSRSPKAWAKQISSRTSARNRRWS